MANEGVQRLFQYNDEEKQEIRSALGLKGSTIQEDVEAIMEWFQKQPHLTDAGIDPDFIERMLINSKGSLEKTKSRIDSYYKYRGLTPELILNREKLLSDSGDMTSTYIQISTPKLYKGHRVTAGIFTSPDANEFDLEKNLIISYLLGDLRMKYDYFLGDIWVVDMKNVSFSYLLRLNPMTLQKSSQIFQEGLGLRIHEIHVVNATNLLAQVISLLRQFVSQKILDRVKVHDSLEELHKHVPKKYLPKDFGGEQPSCLEFRDIFEKEIRSTKTKQFLLDATKMVSDEKKRPGGQINEEFLAGSFRKLDFD